MRCQCLLFLLIFVEEYDNLFWLRVVVWFSLVGLEWKSLSGSRTDWLDLWNQQDIQGNTGPVMFKMSHRVSVSCENNLASLAKIWLRRYARDSTGALIHCNTPVQSWQRHGDQSHLKDRMVVFSCVHSSSSSALMLSNQGGFIHSHILYIIKKNRFNAFVTFTFDHMLEPNQHFTVTLPDARLQISCDSSLSVCISKKKNLHN